MCILDVRLHPNRSCVPVKLESITQFNIFVLFKACGQDSCARYHFSMTAT